LGLCYIDSFNRVNIFAVQTPIEKQMKILILCFAAMLLCASCNKVVDDLVEKTFLTPSTSPSTDFTQYKIPKGQHSADKSTFKKIETTSLHFIVKFDSSAIYQTKTKENQYDINKLYGFSDNNGDHHQYSARFGWRWSDGALRLFAYVYNEGKMSSKELTVVPIGAPIACSIKADSSNYVFTVNGKVETMPRMSKTPTAKGYMLYPYFGGDETAPHEVSVWIKEDKQQ
jgi:hypothetical protein